MPDLSGMWKDLVFCCPLRFVHWESCEESAFDLTLLLPGPLPTEGPGLPWMACDSTEFIPKRSEGSLPSS